MSLLRFWVVIYHWNARVYRFLFVMLSQECEYLLNSGWMWLGCGLYEGQSIAHILVDAHLLRIHRAQSDYQHYGSDSYALKCKLSRTCLCSPIARISSKQGRLSWFPFPFFRIELTAFLSLTFPIAIWQRDEKGFLVQEMSNIALN